MRTLWNRFHGWLYPCDCFCCSGGGADPTIQCVPRPEIDGRATLWTPGIKGETPCREHHEAIAPPCAHCGADL